MDVEKHEIEVEGLPIRYLTAGSGPPLVLLHGAGDNSLDWRWVMPDLAGTHRVYAPDLPGSPDSARPAVDYSPAFFERFAVALVDALDIGRATFVGNSFGGLIVSDWRSPSRPAYRPWSSSTAPASGVRSTRRSPPSTSPDSAPDELPKCEEVSAEEVAESLLAHAAVLLNSAVGQPLGKQFLGSLGPPASLIS